MNRKYEIIIASVVSFTIISLLLVIPDISKIFQVFKDQIEVSSNQIGDSDFIAFAVATNFFYEFIPQTAQFIGVGAIGMRLLQVGFNPWILAGIIAVGKLAGQMLLYIVGWMIKKAHGREFKMMEVIGSWFHKWHYVVFVFPPWLGVIGDGIMLGAGHEGISPVRMIPFLLATNYAEAIKYVVPTMAQLEIADALES